jgi:hypothetical protein
MDEHRDAPGLSPGTARATRLVAAAATACLTVLTALDAVLPGVVTPASASPVAVSCHGSLAGVHLNAPVVGIVATPDQGGYWMVASDGGIFSFGDAQFYGSTGNLVLNKPVVGMASTPDGKGYWLVASDGGVFSYGDAVFHGSAGSLPLNEPIVSMATTPDGGGYWLAAADAGIFSYGDAVYHGGGPFSEDQVSVTDFSAFAATSDGGGYLLATANRAFLLNFGTAQYYGLGSSPGDLSPMAGITTPNAATGYGYWEATQAGSVYALTSSAQTTC